MIITAELSLYPLNESPVPAIVGFIRDLRQHEGVEVVTNQLSTQLRGEFDAVTAAIDGCMRRVMESGDPMVLVAKYLNMNQDIHRHPEIG